MGCGNALMERGSLAQAAMALVAVGKKIVVRVEWTLNIAIFDPEMCCSSGVCGTSPDPELIRVGEMVETLKERGHHVTRHMLSQDPEAFSGNPPVYELLKQQGLACLPIVTVDGDLHSVGGYPAQDELLALPNR